MSGNPVWGGGGETDRHLDPWPARLQDSESPCLQKQVSEKNACVKLMFAQMSLTQITLGLQN